MHRGADNDAEGGEGVAQQKFYLVVSGVKGRLKHFNRHDLWVLGSHPMLQVRAPSPGPLKIYNRCQPFHATEQPAKELSYRLGAIAPPYLRYK